MAEKLNENKNSNVLMSTFSTEIFSNRNSINYKNADNKIKSDFYNSGNSNNITNEIDLNFNHKVELIKMKKENKIKILNKIEKNKQNIYVEKKLNLVASEKEIMNKSEGLELIVLENNEKEIKQELKKIKSNSIDLKKDEILNIKDLEIFDLKKCQSSRLEDIENVLNYEIESPEEFHLIYVKIAQKNKKLYNKFDKVEIFPDFINGENLINEKLNVSIIHKDIDI